MGPFQEDEFNVAGSGSAGSGSAGSGGFSLGSVLGLPSLKDIIGYGMNFIEGAINRSYNAEEAQKARDWQESMWEKNNQYNSPSAQLERMREAGLNPYLMYNGSGQPGNAAVPTASLGAHSDSRMDYSQFAVTSANARLLGEQATTQEIENQYREAMLIQKLYNMSTEAFLNYMTGKEKDAHSQLLMEDLRHYEENFRNLQAKIQAETKEYENLENYRQAQLELERLSQSLERWKVKEEARIALIKDRTQREIALSQLIQQNKHFKDQLAQADRHFKDGLEARDKDRLQQYWQMGINGVNDLVRTIAIYATGGIGFIGSKNSHDNVNIPTSKDTYTRNSDGSYNWNDGNTIRRIPADAVPDKYR